MTEFDKKYKPHEKEKEILKFWEQNNTYTFNPNSESVVFSIDTPPPTLSGKMHIGHACSYTQTDFIARYKRMNGQEVFYPFGTDDNGLATEKLVQKEKKLNLRKVSREEAIDICSQYLEEARPQFIQDWKNLGISCDFDICYSTIDDNSRKVAQQSFLELYNKGLVAQKEGPVPWDRVFQTAIAQAELEDKERTAYLNYVKAKISGTQNTFMIYATTRPELCFAVVGMSLEDNGNYVKIKVGNEYWIVGEESLENAFNDLEFEIVEKLKGKDLIGESVLIPIVEREVEISHDESVKADFGTGIAYFCTYGGIEDIEWVERHNVDPVELIDKSGKLNSKGKKYEGLLAEEARTKIIEDLENNKHLIKKEEKKQIVNVGERSGAEVEYVVSKQWYVTYLDKKELFWEQAQKFNWYPEFMKHRLENWIKGLNWNWGFSRQRHFGIPIPVWYDKQGNKYLPEADELPIDPLTSKPKNAPENVELIPEKDVFDTWFTSASSPFLAISKVKNEEMRSKLFPMSLRPQAHDIINFWLFYTMAKTNLIYDKNPFENVAVSGWVLDSKGKKMSKSKGNVIAPQEIVTKFSNDALRFAAASSKLGQDMPFQEKEVQTGHKITNKIFNANKFASMLLKDFKEEQREFDIKKLRSIDQWILVKLQKVIKEATSSFEKYDYNHAKSAFDHFFMRDIADNYIEIVKQRLWKPEEFGKEETLKAQQALYTSMFASMRGLAPIMPFITEEVYQKFYKQYEGITSIHRCSWPTVNEKYEDPKILELGEKFIEIVSKVRKFKAEKQISMKESISEIIVTCDENTKKFIENSIVDLKNVTSFEEISFKEGDFSIEIKQ